MDLPPHKTVHAIHKVQRHVSVEGACTIVLSIADAGTGREGCSHDSRCFASLLEPGKAAF